MDWFKKTFIVAITIQGVGLFSALGFGRTFFWIQDVIYLPSWSIAVEGWLPWDIIGDRKLIDNYWIATVINLPCVWVFVVLITMPYHMWLRFRKAQT